MNRHPDNRTFGHPEIPPCVVQDIGALGPLPKKLKNHRKSEKGPTDQPIDRPTDRQTDRPTNQQSGV